MCKDNTGIQVNALLKVFKRKMDREKQVERRILTKCKKNNIVGSVVCALPFCLENIEFHQSTISISLSLSRRLEFVCNLKGWNWWNDGKGACGDGQIVYESVL